MACEHTQPTQLISLAENWCQKEKIFGEKRLKWEFWFSENHEAWGHKAIRMAVRWNAGSWSLFVLDRLPDEISLEETGFKPQFLG